MEDEVNEVDQQGSDLSLATGDDDNTEKTAETSPPEERELSELSHVSTVRVEGEGEEVLSNGGNHEFCVKKSTIPHRKAGGILKMGRKSVDTSFNKINDTVSDDSSHVSYRKKSDDQIRRSTKFGPDISETNEDTGSSRVEWISHARFDSADENSARSRRP